MIAQPSLDPSGGTVFGVADVPHGIGELGDGDGMPPGPYTPGMTRWETGDGAMHLGMPFTVRCADGRAIAGHVPSREIAQAIADALNRCRV